MLLFLWTQSHHFVLFLICYSIILAVFVLFYGLALFESAQWIR